MTSPQETPGTPVPAPLQPAMIAPCGMNCAVCGMHLRARRPCPGCRGGDAGVPKHCLSCQIRRCEKLAAGRLSHCGECDSFPCRRLSTLDKRYRRSYDFSLIENLQLIQDAGINKFLAAEAGRWCCRHCGGRVCAHSQACVACGTLTAIR